MQSLVMGVAMASNVGGLTSPISSPQNIFAISLMAQGKSPPNWLHWFAVALPVAVVINVLIWLLLLAVYQPHRKCGDIRPLPAPKDPITSTQVQIYFLRWPACQLLN
jgi:phosphate transporter